MDNRYTPLNNTWAGVVRHPPQKKRGGQPYINKNSPQWAEVQCYTVEEAQRLERVPGPKKGPPHMVPQWSTQDKECADAHKDAAKQKRRTRSPEAAKEAEVGDWNMEARAHALLEEWKKLPSAPYPGLLEATMAEEIMENLLIEHNNEDENTTTKADINEKSTFDFEEWENQEVSDRVGEALTEEEMPPLEQV
ncbi:hypothetical protein RhiJN_17813 [Ceratobasidium sp. AG-Ba]|nr:hypothetical protein RhiJN_17813 [Ceratobasidium sp. AG-Ba]